MSHDHDEGRALLDAARRASEPSDVDRARVRAGVASRLAAAAAAAGAASVTGAASAEAAAAGGAGAGVSAGAASAAGVAGAAAGSMLKTLVVLAAVGAAAGGTGLAIQRWYAPAPRALPSTAVVERLGETPRPSLELPEPPAAAAPTVTPLVELAPPTTPAPAPAKPATARPPAAAPATSAASAPAAPGSANALTAELEALTRARTALRGGDPAAALDALDEHARLSPSPALAEEAAALRVHALCAAGRSSEARTLATHFLDRWPRSPQAPGVRSACPSATPETKEHP